MCVTPTGKRLFYAIWPGLLQLFHFGSYISGIPRATRHIFQKDKIWVE